MSYSLRRGGAILSSVVFLGLFGTSYLSNLLWGYLAEFETTQELYNDGPFRDVPSVRNAAADSDSRINSGDLDGIAAVSKYRSLLESQCENETISKETYRQTLHDMFQPYNAADAYLRTSELEACPYVFLDYGANIGDSLGKFVDSGFSNCNKKLSGNIRYNLTTGTLSVQYERRRLNPLTSFAKQHQMTTPEHYCYVGVEGNPVFTERLQRLEKQVMQTTPRPVRRARFLTETIGVAKDGPAVLFLDTINTRENFYGSSIMGSHVDVANSASQNNATKVEARVQGLSLTTLLNQTVDSTTKHVLIKMDIEGAEYEVLTEAKDTICQIIASGVKMDLLLEMHTIKMLRQGFGLRRNFRKNVMPALRQCGLFVSDGKDGGR